MNRISNIELLRCLLMFMIVVEHFVAHNILGVENPIHVGDVNWVSSNILLALCICSVNCYVIISGYFTINLSLKKLILLLLPVLFYEFMMSIIWYPIKSHLSLTPFNYWFIRPYVALMLFSPVINKGLKSLNGISLRNVLIILLIIYVLPISSLSGNGGKNFLLFSILYITGYYLRNHYQSKLSGGGYFALYLLFVVLIFIEAYFLDSIDKRRIAYNYDNMLVYLAAVSLFMAFAKLNIKSNIINWVATSSFFVYIISENENMYKHPYGIYDILEVEKWNISNYYVIYVISASVVLYVSCIMIDKVRKILFGSLEKRIGDMADSIQKKKFTL